MPLFKKGHGGVKEIIFMSGGMAAGKQYSQLEWYQQQLVEAVGTQLARQLYGKWEAQAKEQVLPNIEYIIDRITDVLLVCKVLKKN